MLCCWNNVLFLITKILKFFFANILSNLLMAKNVIRILEYLRSVYTLIFRRKRLFVIDTSDETQGSSVLCFCFPISNPSRIFPYCLKKSSRFWGFVYLTLGIMSRVERKVFYLIIFSGYIWALARWLCNFPTFICYGNMLFGETVHVRTPFVW